MSRVNTSSIESELFTTSAIPSINPVEFKANTGDAVFYRTYSRVKEDGTRESFGDVLKRTQSGLSKLGKFTNDEAELTERMQRELKVLPSGRWMWVGGTKWLEQQANFYGAYNCSTTVIETPDDFGRIMNLLMQGCGAGFLVEKVNVDKLPKIRSNKVTLEVIGEFGAKESIEETVYENDILTVGDSRKGWVQAVNLIMAIFFSGNQSDTKLTIDISHVRKAESLIKGFGGRANPVDLVKFFNELVEFLNDKQGQKLTPSDCTWIVCRIALTVVAGNIRRSATIAQGDYDDKDFEIMKSGMWTEVDGEWKVDSKKDALRMANLTRVLHKKPDLETVIEGVRNQYYSSEGALMFAPEAIARSNADILYTEEYKQEFISTYCEESPENARQLLQYLYKSENGETLTKEELDNRMTRYCLNPCFAEGTMIMTREGHFPIETLLGKTVEVWDGLDWVEIDNFRVTGERQPVYEIVLHSGQTVTATLGHKFILTDGSKKELKDLEIGDVLLTHSEKTHGIHSEKGAYLKGFMVGDGTTQNGLPALHLYEPKYKCFDRLVESAKELEDMRVLVGSSKTNFSLRHDPSSNRHGFTGISSIPELLPFVQEYRKEFDYSILNWDLPSKLDFIAGYMDADGTSSESSKGFMYQVTSINESFLKGFQLLLTTIGVYSTLRLTKKGGVKDFGSRGGICEIQPLYRLTISQSSSIKLSQQVIFTRLDSFASKTTVYKLKDNSSKIVSINFSHFADKVYCCTVPTNHQVSLSNGLVTGQCGEEIQINNLCNLAEVHLNNINPFDFNEQSEAFRAAALSVCALLHHEFDDPKYQDSRELDPRVQVSFTGLFDFLVSAFGIKWLEWWQEGRPSNWGSPDINLINKLEYGQVQWRDKSLSDFYLQVERDYFGYWKDVVENTVAEYCDNHGLKVPNRVTGVQPAGTKSLLTGASSGWHPPKAQRYIRRITFQAYHPVALACIDMGYSVFPSQSCKDENGSLLNDPYDFRVNEWLIEIPVEVPWASLPGVDKIEIEKFSALAQFDFYMQVQKYYTTINTSATIEYREDEIEALGTRIFEAIRDDEGYVSIALQARFDAPFPRLPFEKINLLTYNQLVKEVESRKKPNITFYESLNSHDKGWSNTEGASGCDSDKCLLPLAEPKLNKVVEGEIFAKV